MPPTDTPRIPQLLTQTAGCAPSPLGWRVLALLLDVILSALAGWLILTLVVLPQQMPEAGAVFNHQLNLFQAQVEEAMTTNQLPPMNFDPAYADLDVLARQTFFLVLLAYFAVSEWTLRGGTLGKQVFRLRTAQWGNAAPPGGFEVLIRCTLKSVSLVYPPLLLLNGGAVLFRRSRRAGHDYLARTIVTGDAPPPRPPAEEHDEDF